MLFVLFYFSFRLIYSTTIFSFSFIDGEIFEGGTKMFFHLDYINPLVEKDVHTKIENYVKNKLDSLQKFDSYETKFDACLLKRELGLFKWWFYDRSNKYAEFKIISLIEEKHRVFFLIEAIDDKHIQCVVEFDENLENLIRFYF